MKNQRILRLPLIDTVAGRSYQKNKNALTQQKNLNALKKPYWKQ